MIICTEQKSDLNSRAKIEKKELLDRQLHWIFFLNTKTTTNCGWKHFIWCGQQAIDIMVQKKRVFVLLTLSDWQRLWVDLYVFKHNSNTCRNNQNWLFLLLYCTRRTTSFSLHQIQSHLILHHQWICKCNELVDSRY